MNQTEKYGVHVTATNREFLNIFKTLNETRSTKGVAYAKAVIKNSEVIKAHLDPIEEQAKPSEEFMNLSIEAQKFINAEDSEGLKKFEEQNVEVIEQRKKQLADVNQQLMDIHQQKQKIDNASGKKADKVTNNAIFVGSTAELSKMIGKMTKGE